MAPEEYRSYLACLDPDRAKHKLQEKQLGTGWFEPRKSLVRGCRPQPPPLTFPHIHARALMRRRNRASLRARS